MATDHKSTSVLYRTRRGSAIENELPTYRAVSSRAVLSLVCGILALFSIANSFFYIFAVLAVVLGFTADWNIQRYPDILTGRRLAQTGAALGLIFGLSVFTVYSVQGSSALAMPRASPSTMGRSLKTGDLAHLLWLKSSFHRKSVSAEEVMEKSRTAKKKEAAMDEKKTSSLRNLKKRLDSSQGPGDPLRPARKRGPRRYHSDRPCPL